MNSVAFGRVPHASREDAHNEISPSGNKERTCLLPHWAAGMCEAERARLLAAWRGNRSCADCRHWGDEEDRRVWNAPLACRAPREGGCGSFLVPADYTCDEWESSDVYQA
jgi:hypothetical protein